jgi:hypothetical protein
VHAFKKTGVLPEELDPVDAEQIERNAMQRNGGKRLSLQQFNLRLDYA